MLRVKYYLIIISLVLLVGVVGTVIIRGQRSGTEQNDVTNNAEIINNKTSMTMKITSQAFDNKGTIPAKYTCDGQDINPPLSFSEVPDKTISLVLIMDDPDVPKNLREDGTWDHWIVFNMPPETKEIVEGVEPPGVHGVGTSGNKEYHGPCPPDREHRYFFKLYALDITLDLSEGATKAEVEQVMAGHVLAEASLIGRYQRQ